MNSPEVTDHIYHMELLNLCGRHSQTQLQFSMETISKQNNNNKKTACTTIILTNKANLGVTQLQTYRSDNVQCIKCESKAELGNYLMAKRNFAHQRLIHTDMWNWTGCCNKDHTRTSSSTQPTANSCLLLYLSFIQINICQNLKANLKLCLRSTSPLLLMCAVCKCLGLRRRVAGILGEERCPILA